jgi:hypothetical protein
LEEKQMCFVAGRDFATLSAISPPLSLSLWLSWPDEPGE